MRTATMTLAVVSILFPVACLVSSRAGSGQISLQSSAEFGVNGQTPRESNWKEPRRERPFTLRFSSPSPRSRDSEVLAQSTSREPSDGANTAELVDVDAPFFLPEWQATLLFWMLDSDHDGQLTDNEIPTYWQERLPADTSLDLSTLGILFQLSVTDATARRLATPWAFETLDTDGDGQVGLYEWRLAGRPILEFRQLDRDGDGFLTRKEVESSTVLLKASPTPKSENMSTPTTQLATPARQLPGMAGVTPANSPADVVLAGFISLAANAEAGELITVGGVTGLAANSSNKTTANTAPITRAPAASPVRPSKAAPAPASPTVSVAKASSTPTPTPSPQALLDALAWTPLPLTGNDHWVQRDTANCLDLLVGKPSKVVFLGDSITELLQDGAGQPLWSRFFEPLGALDFGIGGITTSQVLWQIERGEVAYAAPRVVVLMIGTNNLSYGQSPEAVATGIATIVRALQAQLPRTRILLVGILPRGAGASNPARDQIARTNALIAPLADGNRVTYIDIGHAFLSPDGSLSTFIMVDGVHPSLWGYQIYTAGVLPVLGKLLTRP